MTIVAWKPWRVDGVTVRGAAMPERGELGLLVAKVNWALDDAKHITQAISALPDLLIALQDIVAEIDKPQRGIAYDSFLPAELANKAREALLKAGGPL